jgi:hypothetical protein
VKAPSWQLSAAQTVLPDGYFWQAPLPSQTPLVWQDSLPLSVHVSLGSGAPLATFTHWPGDPGRPQLRQGPAQLFSQQTPSTHWVESHSVASAQGCPFFFLPHIPVLKPLTTVATHVCPSSQSASVRQDPLHAPFVHR